MEKKEALKARGVRLPDEMWRNLSNDAEKSNSTPSDIIRAIITAHYSAKIKGARKNANR